MYYKWIFLLIVIPVISILEYVLFKYIKSDILFVFCYTQNNFDIYLRWDLTAPLLKYKQIYFIKQNRN